MVNNLEKQMISFKIVHLECIAINAIHNMSQ